QQVTPLRLIKPLFCKLVGHGIFVAVRPPRPHSSIVFDGIVPVKIKTIFIAFQIRVVIDAESHLRNVLFVQADRSVRRVPAITTEMLLIYYPYAGDGIQYRAYLLFIYSGQRSA